MRLYGIDAIEAKNNNEEIEINKSADPTEGERFDLTVDEAEEIIREDCNLIYCDVD